mmetsp:Transcript_24701/g.78978  ORF Transcript_24701/g.78978 Transcript_24701/m.78978 type:complete len:221 (-) Transcript_24701:29-691(-)
MLPQAGDVLLGAVCEANVATRQVDHAKSASCDGGVQLRNTLVRVVVPPDRGQDVATHVGARYGAVDVADDQSRAWLPEEEVRRDLSFAVQARSDGEAHLVPPALEPEAPQPVRRRVRSQSLLVAAARHPWRLLRTAGDESTLSCSAQHHATAFLIGLNSIDADRDGTLSALNDLEQPKADMPRGGCEGAVGRAHGDNVDSARKCGCVRVRENRREGLTHA